MAGTTPASAARAAVVAAAAKTWESRCKRLGLNSRTHWKTKLTSPLRSAKVGREALAETMGPTQ